MNKTAAPNDTRQIAICNRCQITEILTAVTNLKSNCCGASVTVAEATGEAYKSEHTIRIPLTAGKTASVLVGGADPYRAVTLSEIFIEKTESRQYRASIYGADVNGTRFLVNLAEAKRRASITVWALREVA